MTEPAGVKRTSGDAERFRQGLGIAMCLLYAAAYCGFVVISVWDVELMDTLMPFRLNLAVFYGFGLIFFALALACVYSRICNLSERACSDAGAGSADSSDHSL